MKVQARWVGLLMAAAFAAQAQAPSVARADVAPSALRDAAVTVVQAVDSGQGSQLWQGATKVTRDAMPQKTFLQSLAQSRQPFGQPLQRQWTAVTLRDVAVQQGNAKPGRYGSVGFDTLFAGNRQARELVSFRLDEDGQWRFAGYVIEPAR